MPLCCRVRAEHEACGVTRPHARARHTARGDPGWSGPNRRAAASLMRFTRAAVGREARTGLLRQEA
eukprot:7387248-Prymnesium_polylepis.2